jgi:hypothetical protein
LHLILPPYYIKLCNECCTQQQPQLPHPCEEETQISSFLSWNFQSTNQKIITGGATSNPKLPNTQKLLLFSSLLVSKANPPKKTNLIRNKTKDKSLQQVQQLDHLQQQQQQQIKLHLLLLLSFLSSAWFLSPTKNTPPQKRTKLAAASTDSYRWINKIFATDFFLSFFLSCLLAFLLLSCY